MNILIVTNPKAAGSIHVYSAACSVNLKNDLRAALLELKLEKYNMLIDKIVDEIEQGNDYWIWHNNDSYCFSIISV